MPSSSQFPLASAIRLTDVVPGTSAAAEGGAQLHVVGTATASISGDDFGVFRIDGMETLALVNDPDARGRFWETVAEVQGAGPVDGGPGFGVTIRFACPDQPAQDAFTAIAVLTVSQSGTSVTHEIPIFASVLPEGLTVQVDPPSFFIGETKDVSVIVRSTYRRGISGILTGGSTPAAAFSFEPLVGVATVPRLNDITLTVPVKCADATTVGDYKLTFVFQPDDATVSPAADTEGVRVLAHRTVSVTSDFEPQLTLLHPSATDGALEVTLSGGPATVFFETIGIPATVSLNLPEAVSVDTNASVPVTINVQSSPTGFSDAPAPITVAYSVPPDDFHPEEVKGSLVVSEVTLPPRWRRVPSGELGPGTATGSATILVQQDGLTNFQGHVHDSGFFGESYVFAMAFLDVLDAQGHTVVFAHQGDLAGTLGGGSTRSDDWNISGPDDATQMAFIRDNWDAFMSSRVESRMQVTTDPGGVIEAVVAALFAGLGITVFVLALTGNVTVVCNPVIEGGADSIGFGFTCVIQ
jgi:hypothetical protein